MFKRPETHVLIRSILAIAAVIMLSTPADAAPFQLVKVFETALIGTEQFQITIETQVLGIWIEVPCIDDIGSCTYTFSDLAAGTSVVLADSNVSWFSGGSFYVREVAPPGWALQFITSAGTSTLVANVPGGEVYFSFDLSGSDDGHVTLHNVGPAVPEPGTVALFGLGLAALRMRRRHRRPTTT